MTTLEDLLRLKVDVGFGKVDLKTPPFRVHVEKVTPEGVHFVIHPNGYDGDVLDFIAKGNTLTPVEESDE